MRPTALQQAAGLVCLRLLNEYWNSEIGSSKDMRYMPRSFWVRYNDQALDDLGERLLELAGTNCMTVPIYIAEDDDSPDTEGTLTFILDPGIYTGRDCPAISITTTDLARMAHPTYKDPR